MTKKQKRNDIFDDHTAVYVSVVRNTSSIFYEEDIARWANTPGWNRLVEASLNQTVLSDNTEFEIFHFLLRRACGHDQPLSFKRGIPQELT